MSLELYFAFVAATAVLIIMPGPVVSLVIANALTHGTRAGLVTVGGAQAAIAIQLVVVALGLTSLVAVMAEWFEWLRWIGAAYLVWLGIQKWRAKPLLPEERPSGWPSRRTASPPIGRFSASSRPVVITSTSAAPTSSSRSVEGSAARTISSRFAN